MTPSIAAQVAPSTWVNRLYDAAAIAPGWVGLGLLAVLWASVFGVEWALGRDLLPADGRILESHAELFITLVMCAALAYLWTATVCVVREGPVTVAALAPLLRADPAERAALVDAAGRFPRGVMLAAGAGGAALGLLVPYLEVGYPGWQPYDWRLWSAESASHRLLSPLLGWWATRLLAAMIVGSLRLSRLADRIETIDLLDPAPLTPFALKGLANTFWLAGLVAFISFMLLDAERYGDAMVMLITLPLVGAVVALLLPLRGIHRRIGAAKWAELGRIHAALRGDDAALAGTALAGRTAAPSVADLIAYRGLVESVREWPLGAPTLLRFALYLLIPVGSWAGGAVFERMLDALLD